MVKIQTVLKHLIDKIKKKTFYYAVNENNRNNVWRPATALTGLLKEKFVLWIINILENLFFLKDQILSWIDSYKAQAW